MAQDCKQWLRSGAQQKFSLWWEVDFSIYQSNLPHKLARQHQLNSYCFQSLFRNTLVIFGRIGARRVTVRVQREFSLTSLVGACIYASSPAVRTSVVVGLMDSRQFVIEHEDKATPRPAVSAFKRRTRVRPAKVAFLPVNWGVTEPAKTRAHGREEPVKAMVVVSREVSSTATLRRAMCFISAASIGANITRIMESLHRSDGRPRKQNTEEIESLK